jgi:dynein heavy chain 2
MKVWRAHWDRQLYKALEFQYQVGLEALSEHLPEMKIELVYRYFISILCVLCLLLL